MFWDDDLFIIAKMQRQFYVTLGIEWHQTNFSEVEVEFARPHSLLACKI